MSERQAEIPWAVGLAKAPVLDVGCFESTYLSLLPGAADGIDLRQCSVPGKFYQGDIRTFTFPQQYATVLAISTLEHIGLAHEPYGTKADGITYGDRNALVGCLRAVQPGGQLLVSVPWGKPLDYGWFRQYDEKRLKVFLEPVKSYELRVKVAPNWEQVYPWSCEDLEYDFDSGSARAVALIRIFVP